MEIKTLKKIIDLLENVASRDKTRLNLMTVHITDEFLEATDGIILARVFHNDLQLTNYIKETFITREMLPYLKLIIKENKKRLSLPENDIVITHDSITLKGRLITCSISNYPNLSRLFSRYESTYTVKFNAKFLMNLAKALANHTTYYPMERNRLIRKYEVVTLEINPNDPEAPIIVNKTENDIGLLMPIRK